MALFPCNVGSGGTSIIYIGNAPNTGNQATLTFDVTDKVSDWANATADNFFLSPKGTQTGFSSFSSFTFSKSYNASTGVLSVTRGKGSGGTSAYMFISGDVYYTSKPLPTS